MKVGTRVLVKVSWDSIRWTGEGVVVKPKGVKNQFAKILFQDAVWVQFKEGGCCPYDSQQLTTIPKKATKSQVKALKSLLK